MKQRPNGSYSEKKGEPENSPLLSVIDRAIARSPLLTAQAERELAIRVRDYNDPEARIKLIESNYRLVMNLARKRVKMYPHSTFEDLISNGVLGLHHAVERFDYQRGYRFSTYATHWIKQAIGRLSGSDRTIRLPVHVLDKLADLLKATMLLEQRLSRKPTVEELAQYLGFNEELVMRLQICSNDTVSLESPVGDNNSILGDFLPDGTTVVEPVIDELDGIGALLRRLPSRELAVIWLRFGLGGEEQMPLQLVAFHLGITREAVRKIEERAIRRMRSLPEASEFLLSQQ